MSDDLSEIIGAELMRRFKKLANSKKARMSVSLHGAGFEGHWKTLVVRGRATLIGFEENFWFDFSFVNNDAYKFLETCKMEIPERPDSETT